MNTITASPVPAPRPIPGGGRPKPRLNNNPRAKVLFSYIANEGDEISLDTNEYIEILLEGKFQSMLLKEKSHVSCDSFYKS